MILDLGTKRIECRYRLTGKVWYYLVLGYFGRVPIPSPNILVIKQMKVLMKSKGIYQSCYNMLISYFSLDRNIKVAAGNGSVTSV